MYLFVLSVPCKSSPANSVFRPWHITALHHRDFYTEHFCGNLESRRIANIFLQHLFVGPVCCITVSKSFFRISTSMF